MLTARGTGKAKRLRHTPRVVLQACDRRGRPAPGAPEVPAEGEVLEDRVLLARLRRALRAKYGLAATAFLALRPAADVVQRLRRRPPSVEVAVRVRPGAASGRAAGAASA